MPAASPPPAFLVPKIALTNLIMLAQLPPEISGLLTSKTLTWVTAAWVLLQSAGRVYHAVVAGGGLLSIWRALIYGTNVPTAKEAVAATAQPADRAANR